MNRLINHKRISRYSLATIALITLCGCQTLNASLANDTGSSIEVKKATQQVLGDRNQWRDQISPAKFANTGWLSDLNDEALNGYISRALKNNPDLKASAASLKASIAQAKATNANRWPTLSLLLQPSRSQINPTGDQILYNTNLGQSLEASWEADIWGRLSAERKVAFFSTELERANYKAAELTLVANVARAWYNVNANKLTLELNRKQLQSQRDTLDVVENAYKSGLNSALDVFLNNTDIANRQSAILNDEEIYEQSVRAFKQLLGGYPDDDFEIEAKLPSLEIEVPAGLPAEMIGRRPDVLASLRRYQSAEQNALVARKAKLPSFSLTARYGGSSDSLRLLDSNQLLWNLAGNLAAPIFRGGELKAIEEQASYLKDASLQNYVSTLLSSFAEVENALSAETKLRKRLAAFEQAVFYSESAYDLALEQYRSGINDYTTLLEAQRRWFAAEVNFVALQNALLQNRISLYLALGGDFATNDISSLEPSVNPNSSQ